MTSIMWWPSHITLIQLEIHSEPLLELSMATTFPQSIYAQIHQHHLMCPAVQGHSASSLLVFQALCTPTHQHILHHYNGKEYLKEECMHVYNYFAVQQKLAQHCKSTILQLKNREK